MAGPTLLDAPCCEFFLPKVELGLLMEPSKSYYEDPL